MLVLVLLMGSHARADLRLDALLQQGISEYEYENYPQAFEHFSAALVYANSAGLSLMYPGAYLCAAWYHGHGVAESRERAEVACQIVHGNLSGYQLRLFRDVLERNSSEASPLPQKKALADAATALAWYIQRKGIQGASE